MPIRYIHNDPASIPYLESVLDARGPRTGPLAGFDIPLPAPDVYESGTIDFVDHQCNEAALRTLEVWETIAAPLRFWHNRQRSLKLKSRRETGFGASYDRISIGFDFHPVNNPQFFVGASADAVSHEIGHGILDALRPELWDSFFTEVAAFHEGFADCMSLLVALTDEAILNALYATSVQPEEVLTTVNATSQVAESIAEYYMRVFGAGHATSTPRRLRNSYQWAIPSTLPTNPTPNKLAREPHSFGQLFSGCFYDCINNIYLQQGAMDSSGLRQAAITAGKILASAILSAPEEARFFRSVGRTMIHADNTINGGVNHSPISDAFKAHNVQLGSAALLAPTASLDGPSPPKRGPTSRRLNPKTRNDLVKRTGADKGARVSTDVIKVGSQSVVRAKIRQPVDVDVSSQDGTLVVVRAQSSQDVMLNGQRGQCVVLGDIPNQVTTEQEVNTFIQSLAENGDMENTGQGLPSSHKIRKRGEKRVLQRARFSCCHCRNHHSR